MRIAPITAVTLSLGLLLGAAAPAPRPVAGGDLGVMPKGRYVCEVPGDAGDPGIAGGRHRPEADFQIVGDSEYRAGDRRGIYLLTGDSLRMTSGPLAGRRFRREETTFLRALTPAGADDELRCISSIQAIGIDPPEGRRCAAPRPQDAIAQGVTGGRRPASC